MPGWWSRKSKSKPKPDSSASCSSSPRDPNPILRRSSKKEKANSFDEVLARKARTLSPLNGSGFVGGEPGPFTFGHPLPQPISSPLPWTAGTGSATASASSASSSGSDDAPDFGFYR